MKFFVRAIVSGFGFSLGAALFKRVSNRLGLEDTGSDDEPGDEAERETGNGRGSGDGEEPADQQPRVH